MGIRLSKHNNNSTIKYSDGTISEDYMIASLFSKTSNPITYKCKTTLRYMFAFILDLMRSITSFEDYITKIVDLDSLLSILLQLEFKNPELFKPQQLCIKQIPIIYSDETYPNFLV